MAAPRRRDPLVLLRHGRLLHDAAYLSSAQSDVAVAEQKEGKRKTRGPSNQHLSIGEGCVNSAHRLSARSLSSRMPF